MANPPLSSPPCTVSVSAVESCFAGWKEGVLSDTPRTYSKGLSGPWCVGSVLRAAHSPAGPCKGHGINICPKVDCVTYIGSGAQHATKSTWAGMCCLIPRVLSMTRVGDKNCAVLYLASSQLPQGVLW